MTLNQLRYFRVLAKTEHYTKAADALAISQPSLSRAIALLEEELGVLLSMVQAGLGLFISTDHPQMYSPDTVLVPLKQERYRRYVYMVTRPGLAASTAAAQLICYNQHRAIPKRGRQPRADGGIADLNDARDFIALGADRLGTSRIVKAVKAMEQ